MQNLLIGIPFFLSALLGLSFGVITKIKFGYKNLTNDQKYYWVRGFGIGLILFFGSIPFLNPLNFNKTFENLLDPIVISIVFIFGGSYLIFESRSFYFKFQKNENTKDFEFYRDFISFCIGCVFFVFGFISLIFSTACYIVSL